MTTLSYHRGKYNVKALEYAAWEADMSAPEAENLLLSIGIPEEEVTIAFGLIEAGDMDSVQFDATNRAVIDEEYGELDE